MDRHLEFATQLSRIVQLYAREPDDAASQKAALRAARAAVKHGAVALSVEDGALRAGSHTVPHDVPHTDMLRDALQSAGVKEVRVVHHAKQSEIRSLAELLARVARGELDMRGFAKAHAAESLSEVILDFTPEAVAAVLSGEPEAATAPDDEPPAAEAPAETHDDAAPASEAAAPHVEAAAEAELAAASPIEAAPLPAVSAGPLATELPPAAAALEKPSQRELFARLITSSEPGTLRRLLEPVHLAIEQTIREGASAEALHLLQALLSCETLSDDPEMRRQFVVALRRLTKPTLLRSLAMLYVDAPELAPAVEQLMLRFGEDGAEAVVDRIFCAGSADARAQYTALLRRLPAARDALNGMLEEDSPAVVERAIALIAQMKFNDAERAIAEELSHAEVRVRRAAAVALGSFAGSAFALDALLRAAQDSSAEVRLPAVVALQARREHRLAATLVQRLDEEQELDVQLAIITALGKVAAPEGVQKLIALSQGEQRMLRRRDSSTDLRLSAIEAMGEARTPQAMVALQKLLEDKSADVRETAARLYTRARRQTSTGSIPAITEP